MKKWLIGSIVGAILLFLWQFLSWTVLELHSAEATYTPQQESIMTNLSSALTADGVYMLPTAAPGTSRQERMDMGEKMNGKPYAVIMYKTAFEYNMTKPMIRGFLIDFALVLLFIYIISSSATPTRMRIFAAAIAIGVFAWLWGPYTAHNWFQAPVKTTTGHLIDALAGWGLVGIWLGWWLNRK